MCAAACASAAPSGSSARSSPPSAALSPVAACAAWMASRASCPQREHRSGGNVARAASCFIRLFAELQQRHQLVADSHRPGRRLCVDVGQVHQPVIARVDVKQLVAAQKVCVQRVRLRLPFGFAGGVTGHDGHGVEQVPPGRAVFFGLCAVAVKTDRKDGGQREPGQGGQKAAAHACPPDGLMFGVQLVEQLGQRPGPAHRRYHRPQRDVGPAALHRIQKTARDFRPYGPAH